MPQGQPADGAPQARPDDLGSPHGGGPQGERVEGSLTDGGSLPGHGRDDRSFGAGRRAEPGPSPKITEGSGEDPGSVEDEADAAGP